MTEGLPFQCRWINSTCTEARVNGTSLDAGAVEWPSIGHTLCADCSACYRRHKFWNPATKEDLLEQGKSNSSNYGGTGSTVLWEHDSRGHQSRPDGYHWAKNFLVAVRAHTYIGTDMCKHLKKNHPLVQKKVHWMDRRTWVLVSFLQLSAISITAQFTILITDQNLTHTAILGGKSLAFPQTAFYKVRSYASSTRSIRQRWEWNLGLYYESAKCHLLGHSLSEWMSQLYELG